MTHPHTTLTPQTTQAHNHRRPTHGHRHTGHRDTHTGQHHTLHRTKQTGYTGFNGYSLTERATKHRRDHGGHGAVRRRENGLTTPGCRCPGRERRRSERILTPLRAYQRVTRLYSRLLTPVCDSRDPYTGDYVRDCYQNVAVRRSLGRGDPPRRGRETETRDFGGEISRIPPSSPCDQNSDRRRVKGLSSLDPQRTRGLTHVVTPIVRPVYPSEGSDGSTVSTLIQCRVAPREGVAPTRAPSGDEPAAKNMSGCGERGCVSC